MSTSPTLERRLSISEIDVPYSSERQEQYDELLRIFHQYIPSDSQQTKQEICFHIVWQACGTDEGLELVKKVRGLILSLRLSDNLGRNIFFKCIEEGDKQRLENVLKEEKLTPGEKPPPPLFHSLSNGEAIYSLHFAIRIGTDREIAQKLIYKSITRPSQEDLKGRIPLHYAIRKGHAELIEPLLPKVNDGSILPPQLYHSSSGLDLCPLSLAVLKNSKPCLDELVRIRKIKPSSVRIDGVGTLLHLTVREGRLEMLEYLLTHYYEDTRPLIDQEYRGQTPLMLAAIKGDLPSLVLLINKSKEF